MLFEDKGIFGPDLSFYQADPNKRQFVDYHKMKAWRNEKGEGISFVIIKASQRQYHDPAFAVNRAAAREAGIPRAFYHFLDYRADGKAQAQFFWNLIKDDPGEGPLIVDFEDGSGFWEHRLEDFIVELQRLSKYAADRIWIYTGYYYWLEMGPQTAADQSWFSQYRVWIAAYTDKPDYVKVPRPWITSTMWQRGVTIVYGPDLGVLSLELDWNSFNGDREAFNRYWITGYVPEPIPVPEPEEPTQGEHMKYQVIWNYGVARRKAPHTGTAAVNTFTGLTYGYLQEVDVIEENIPDANDPTNTSKRWVKFVDGLYGASSYPNSAGVSTTRMVKLTEPTPIPTRPAFRFKVDGYREIVGTLEKE
jgi:hypothetical protein